MHLDTYNLQLKRGLLQDTDNQTFGPEDPITRGHMAFLLQRAFSLTEEGNVEFKDVTRTDAQTQAINRIASAGLTNGYPDGTYKPIFLSLVYNMPYL